jgi:selenocysteine lyase/cysteine desulfurase
LEDNGVEVKLAPLTGSGEIDITTLISLVDERTKAVVLTLASNVTGCAPDIYRLRSSIPPSTLLICDGAQACGHVKINMKESGIDGLAVAGHKGMLGIQGSGALLFSERINPDPITFGGTGSESNNLHMPDFYPDKLESGTLSYPAIVSLGEGVIYLRTHLHENRDKVVHLTNVLLNGLHRIGGVTIYSKPNPYGIVAFNLNNMQSEIAAYRLSEEYSICVRGGLHCAPLMHKALGSEGAIRASLSAFNNQSEVDFFLTALTKLTKE